MSEKKRKGILYYYALAALLSLEIMLAFSKWGDIRLQTATISTVSIVVLLSAYLLGIWEGVFAGVIYGLTGMWNATVVTTKVAYVDLILSPVRSGKPTESVVLCLVPRILLGLTAGVLFHFAKKAKKHKILMIALSAALAQTLHFVTAFYYMYHLFPETQAYWWTAVRNLGKTGIYLIIILSILVILLACYLSASEWLKDKLQKIREGVMANKYTKVVYWQWIVLIVIAACGMSVCFKFSDGISGIVHLYNVLPGETSTEALYALLVQFTIAELSLLVLIGIMQSLIYYYYASAEVRSRMDMMTGAFNRAMLIQTVERDMKNLRKGQKLLFIMMDVDYFKQINDTYGHDFGDSVLISLVHILQRNFAGDAFVGRMGGDEFAIYCRHGDIEHRLADIMEQVTREFDQVVVPGDRIGVLNFSYGIAWGKYGMEFEELYKLADQDLYEHKHIRRQYIDNSKGNV